MGTVRYRHRLRWQLIAIELWGELRRSGDQQQFIILLHGKRLHNRRSQFLKILRWKLRHNLIIDRPIRKKENRAFAFGNEISLIVWFTIARPITTIPIVPLRKARIVETLCVDQNERSIDRSISFASDLVLLMDLLWDSFAYANK